MDYVFLKKSLLFIIFVSQNDTYSHIIYIIIVQLLLLLFFRMPFEMPTPYFPKKHKETGTYWNGIAYGRKF